MGRAEAERDGEGWGGRRKRGVGRDMLTVFLFFAPVDMKDLENVLRSSIIEGQPITHRPWKKILIVVEGIYRLVAS